MERDVEITVKVNTNYNELQKDLLSKGFKQIKEFQLNDIFMLPSCVDIKNSKEMEILNNCVLIRDVNGVDLVSNEKINKLSLTYKNKEVNSKGEILRQSSCALFLADSIQKAEEFLTQLKYKRLFEIKDFSTVWTNGKIEFATK